MSKLLSGRSVLVIEDEMMVLWNIENVLADVGCTAVSSAATVRQALALIDTQAFDAAMLDVNLDGELSYAVADALALRRIPFVFSTGYSDPGLGGIYRDRPVLTKPYRDEDLTEKLAGLLTNPAAPDSQ